MLFIYMIIAVIVAISLTVFVAWNDDYDFTSISDVLNGALLWPLLAILIATDLITSYIKERTR